MQQASRVNVEIAPDQVGGALTHDIQIDLAVIDVGKGLSESLYRAIGLQAFDAVGHPFRDAARFGQHGNAALSGGLERRDAKGLAAPGRKCEQVTESVSPR